MNLLRFLVGLSIHLLLLLPENFTHGVSISKDNWGFKIMKADADLL
jgi:hypothetical protein